MSVRMTKAWVANSSSDDGPAQILFQFSGVEILAEVGQALLEFQEGITYVLFVGEKNIAPHGVRARGDSGHLFEGAPSCVEQGASSPYSSTRVAAKAVEISCGRWLIQEQSWSCSSASMLATRAPIFSIHSRKSPATPS